MEIRFEKIEQNYNWLLFLNEDKKQVERKVWKFYRTTCVKFGEKVNCFLETKLILFLFYSNCQFLNNIFNNFW